MKWIKLMQRMKGGEDMDRKELLLKLCEELTKAVECFYHEEDAGLKAHLGEVLGRYGSLLANIGWAITWANEEVQDKVFEVIEDAFRRKHLLKCRLEEWLSWKVGEIVEEALEDKGGERETQQTQTDELPF
jgi:predicted house-cleaning noncanonical NTP pyrophosphatase (MazG superfamily)